MFLQTVIPDLTISHLLSSEISKLTSTFLMVFFHTNILYFFFSDCSFRWIKWEPEQIRNVQDITLFRKKLLKCFYNLTHQQKLQGKLSVQKMKLYLQYRDARILWKSLYQLLVFNLGPIRQVLHEKKRPVIKISFLFKDLWSKRSKCIFLFSFSMKVRIKFSQFFSQRWHSNFFKQCLHF